MVNQRRPGWFSPLLAVIALAVFGAAAGGGGGVPGPLVPAAEVSELLPLRIAGNDRYDTAAAIARSEFTGLQPHVVLDPGENFPDAMSASYLAGLTGSPLLLTAKAALPRATSDALVALGTSEVTIIGGEPAVSNQVVADLADLGVVVDRIGGSDRYATAAKVAGTGRPGVLAGKATAVLASGRIFPDALSAGPATT